MRPNHARVRKQRLAVDMFRIPLEQAKAVLLQDKIETGVLFIAALGTCLMDPKKKCTVFPTKHRTGQRCGWALYLGSRPIADLADSRVQRSLF